MFERLFNRSYWDAPSNVKEPWEEYNYLELEVKIYMGEFVPKDKTPEYLTRKYHEDVLAEQKAMFEHDLTEARRFNPKLSPRMFYYRQINKGIAYRNYVPFISWQYLVGSIYRKITGFLQWKIVWPIRELLRLVPRRPPDYPPDVLVCGDEDVMPTFREWVSERIAEIQGVRERIKELKKR